MRSLPDERAAAARRRRAAAAVLLALGWLVWLGGRGRLRLTLGGDGDEASTRAGRSPWPGAAASGPASSTSVARDLAGDWSFPGGDRTLVLPPTSDGPHLIPGQPAPFGLEYPGGRRSTLATAAQELRRSTAPAPAPAAPEEPRRREDVAETPRTLIPVPDPKASGLREVEEPRYRSEPARSWTSDAAPEEAPAIAVDPSQAVLWVDTDGSGRLKPAGVPKK